jgi:hypothetical protein
VHSSLTRHTCSSALACIQDRKRTLRCYRSRQIHISSEKKQYRGCEARGAAVLVTPIGAGRTKAASQGWDESQPRGRGNSNESNTPPTSGGLAVDWAMQTFCLWCRQSHVSSTGKSGLALIGFEHTPPMHRRCANANRSEDTSYMECSARSAYAAWQCGLSSGLGGGPTGLRGRTEVGRVSGPRPWATTASLCVNNRSVLAMQTHQST